MNARWGAILALALSAVLGGLSGANAENSGHLRVAQASSCELAREIWGDLKGTSSQAAINAYITQFSACPVYAALAEERLGELGGTVLAPQQVPAPVQAAAIVPETECDRLAGYPFEPRLPGLEGVGFNDIDADAAIAACTQARADHPDEKFFSFLLSRSYLKADRSDPRAEELVREGIEGYEAFGLSRLGSLYSYGDGGLAQDYGQAVRYSGQSCDMGDASGCNDLGSYYQHGNGVEQNPERAAELFDRACAAGSSISCNNIGRMYRDGDGIVQDSKAANDYFEEACRLGDAAQCNVAGLAYHNGNGVVEDMLKASDLYRMACEGNIAVGCANLAVMYRNGRGVTADRVLAADFAERACNLGDPEGCNHLATYYRHGGGRTVDDQKATRIFVQACEAGSVVACGNAGMAYEAGTGVAANLDTAIGYYEAGCTENHQATCNRQHLATATRHCNDGLGHVCARIAELYLDGTGVTQDLSQAARFFGLACDNEWVGGCLKLAEIYDADSTDWTTYNQVPVLFERACDLGHFTYCVNAAVHYWQGDRKPVDHAKALKLLQRGCDGQNKQACMTLADSMKEIFYDDGDLNLATPVVNGHFAGYDLREAAPFYYGRACGHLFRNACSLADRPLRRLTAAEREIIRESVRKSTLAIDDSKTYDLHRPRSTAP